MPKSIRALLTSTAFSLVLCAGAAKATTFDVDIVHSHIAFFIDHLGFSKVIGTANDFTGTFEFDAAKPEASTLNVTVKVAGLSTNSKQRDGDIQGADWFNATEFPDITFVGKEFKKVDDKTGTIAGDLTITGVTKPTTLNVTFNKEGRTPGTRAMSSGSAPAQPSSAAISA